tara:strand:- start:371 stop:1213 length:843 start_codon:yes stop_codon:yes gene_type:complete
MGGGGDHGGPRKPLMCRGREIRTVEDAAALDCILELAHDQNGCRFLQDQLDLRAKLHIDLIFEAVLSAVVHLAMDPFGNYLIQKLLQYGVTAQRTRLVRAAAPNIIEIALNVHGTRAVQKMVEVADADEQADAIVGAIEQRAMELVQDMNGNHVVQRVLAVMGPQRSAFVYDLAQRECLAVSMHRHGCCVMQRCLDHANSATRNAIIEQVLLPPSPLHAAHMHIDMGVSFACSYPSGDDDHNLNTCRCSPSRLFFCRWSTTRASSCATPSATTSCSMCST